ncbi:hypothetical protein IAT40_005891 [Kwoniella sp. CBS 6097]
MDNTHPAYHVGSTAPAPASAEGSAGPSNNTSGSVLHNFKCDFEGCRKTFTRKDHLLRHAANHSPETFDCPKCTRPFKRLDLLQRHEKRNICSPDDPPYSVKRRRTSESDDYPPPIHPSSISTSNSTSMASNLHASSTPFSATGQTNGTSASMNGVNDTMNMGNQNTLFINSNPNIPHNANANANTNAGTGDIITDWSLGTWGPENWEAYLMESLAPPFNEPLFNTNWDLYNAQSQSQSPFGIQAQAQAQAQAQLQAQIQPSVQASAPAQPPPHTHSGTDLNHHHHRYDDNQPATLPRLTQESAERGQGYAGYDRHGKRHGVEIQPGSVVTADLLTRLRSDFPDFNVSLSFLDDALSSYWNKTAPTFPFIHRGTFDLNTAPADLIVMMSILGSVHLTPRLDFSHLVQKIRGTLVQGCGLDMPVSTLQAFCLCHVHDGWYSTAESQFVAQCMWPIMVAHSRKKGIGVAGRPENEVQEEEAWTAWAKDEERRRAAYCVLLIDTQISAFWNQHCSRQLSIFAHNLTLPCSKSQWEASNPHEWFQIRDSERLPTPPSSIVQLPNSALTPTSNTHSLNGSKDASDPDPRLSRSRSNPRSNSTPSTAMTNASKRSGFLPGLHPEFTVNIIAEGYSSAILSALAIDSFKSSSSSSTSASAALKLPFKVDLESCLTVQMVLIGLMAIAWDCRTRGGMGIRFKEGTRNWRQIVFSAVIHLRAAYETSVVHMSGTIESRDLRDTFAICIISVLSDIPMLHVAAGATSFCGTFVGPRQYSDAKRRLKLWAKTEDAWTCVWQSVRYLRQSLFSEWGLYSSWAVFNTTLVVWGYAWACSSASEPIPVPAPTTTPGLSRTSSSHDPTTHIIDPSHRHQQRPPISGATSTCETPGSMSGSGSGLDKQRLIVAWLQNILSTQGRIKLHLHQIDQNRSHDELEAGLGAEGELDHVLEYVSGRLSVGEDTDRDNGRLLSRLMMMGSSGPAPMPKMGQEQER